MLGLVAMARPPYVALALLPLGLITLRWRPRLWASVFIAGLAGAWSIFVSATTLTNFGAFLGANPQAQLARLWSEPPLIIHVAWETLRQNGYSYFSEFVGVLGWLDTTLPQSFYPAAGAIIVVAALSAMMRQGEEQRSSKGQLLIAASLVLCATSVFAIQYLTWTEPGHAVVDGVQGRYFIPIALVGTGLLPALGSVRLSPIRSALVVIVALFPIVTLAETMRAVILRYYLQ